jgi:hypothetical protein
MTLSRTLKTSAAVALCTAAVAQAALAAGEQKNVRPFTDPAKTNQSSSSATIPGSTVASAWTAMVGDAKNLQPFIRPLAATDALERYLRQNQHAATITSVGEPKNELPFTLLADR